MRTEAPLNINFTEKEYRLLLDAVFLAEWIMTSHDTERGSDDDPHQMLFQKVYSYAKEMRCGDLVEEEAESNRYVPTRLYESESNVLEWIEEYNALSFWDELIERLAERDVLNETPPEDMDRMETQEYWSRVEPHEQGYAQEFETHGLDRLVIDES